MAVAPVAGCYAVIPRCPPTASRSSAVRRLEARRSGEVGRDLGRSYSAGFVLALPKDGESKGEQEDQQDDQNPERQTLPHLVSSLEYRPSRILTQSAGSVFELFTSL